MSLVIRFRSKCLIYNGNFANENLMASDNALGRILIFPISRKTKAARRRLDFRFFGIHIESRFFRFQRFLRIGNTLSISPSKSSKSSCCSIALDTFSRPISVSR